MKSPIPVSSVVALVLLPVANLAAQNYWPPDEPDQQQTAPLQNYSGQQYAEPGSGGVNGEYGGGSGYEQPGLAPLRQPLGAEQLQQLVAPVALYPDALLAQVLGASTYPGEVLAADQWLRGMAGASPEQVAAGANAHSEWDPSVKALTAFPQTLGMLAQNMEWTTSLGNAYYNQPQDLMQTVQVLRQRAEEAGNLESTPQEQVYDNQGAVELAPQQPDVVYVPSYDPWTVYGAPLSPYPGFYYGGGYWGPEPIFYGAGIGIGAWEMWPFGWGNWGFNWMAGAVLFGNNCYWTHSRQVRDWGFRYGGPRAPNGPALAHFGNGGGYRSGPIPVRPGQGLPRQGLLGRGGSPIGRPSLPVARPQYPVNRGSLGGNYQGGSYQGGRFGQPVRPPQQQGFLHSPASPIRSPYSSYRGPGFANRPQPMPSPARPGSGFAPYGGARPTYRAAAPTMPRGPVYARSGNGFTPYSGGHSEPRFPSGGRSSGGFGGSAPRGFSGGGGHFGGGPSFGGGHSSGGGGHSFGGGGHSSGGGGGRHR